MWVAGGNLPSANFGNDQDAIMYSRLWLLSVSFQPLRIVLRDTNSNRVPKAWACGRNTPIEYNSKHPLCRTVSTVSRHWFRLSNCPEQFVCASHGFELSSITPSRAHTIRTTPHDGLHLANNFFYIAILCVATELNVFRSVSAVLMRWLSLAVRKRKTQTRPRSSAPPRHSTTIKTRITYITLIDI